MKTALSGVLPQNPCLPLINEVPEGGVIINHSVTDCFQSIPDVKIGIDKMLLGIPLAKGAEKDFATKFHLEDEIFNSEHKPQFKKIKKTGHSALVGRYFSPFTKRRILTITAGVIWGKPYCQFFLNPNTTAADDWNVIENILCTCFDYGLKELLVLGQIRKLELSIDFKNTPTSSLITLASHVRSVWTYKNTRYIGKRTSKLSIATYDKTKQLSAVKGVNLDHELTRIEARIALPNKTLLDLAKGEVPNPWDRIFRSHAHVTA